MSYASYTYAASQGRVRAMPNCGGHAIVEEYEGHWDARGPYPLFCCSNLFGVWEDLANMTDLVSFVGVTFGTTAEVLQVIFDHVRSFKRVYLVNKGDLKISKHHRYYVKQAKKNVSVEVGGSVVEWKRLYGCLGERHDLRYAMDFDLQFETPGLVVFTAKADGRVVGMHLWFEDGPVAYSHLAACDRRGYELMAAYALHDAAIEHLTADCLYLGGPAGYPPDYDDGLARFKRGWASREGETFLVGRVLKPDVYRELSKGKECDWFPRYRFCAKISGQVQSAR